MFPLFPLGPNCGHARHASCARESEAAAFRFAHHAIGDWGQLEPTDVAENGTALLMGFGC